MEVMPFYELQIYIDPDICDDEIENKYKDKIAIIQQKVELYKNRNGDSNFAYIDAGFDLFIPEAITIKGNTWSNKINQGIKCVMKFNGFPTAFYLYPRSSTGSKTTLRLSNSVGIIDSGYRGHIIAVFDCGGDSIIFGKGERLVQICGPNIMYPIYPVLVDNVEELGITERGSGGFGSTR